jgi:hypothetical protein
MRRGVAACRAAQLPLRHQRSFSGELLAAASVGSAFRLRCAAITAHWSCAMRCSLRSGGVGSAITRRSFLDLLSLALLDISGLPKSLLRNGNMPASDGPTQDFTVVAQQCWNGLEETAVNMLCGSGCRLAPGSAYRTGRMQLPSGGRCNFYRPSGFYPDQRSYE